MIAKIQKEVGGLSNAGYHHQKGRAQGTSVALDYRAPRKRLNLFISGLLQAHKPDKLHRPIKELFRRQVGPIHP